jgi:uncharacterized membrane protein|tara:strand:+ start:1498 stop:1902 length:405 start_codon:yes stop_codon:yes gene_type:complete
MISDWHPLVIHFPIALLSTSVVFDFIYYYSKNKDLLVASWWILLTGLIASIAAIASGIIDDSLIGHFGAVWPIWYNHGAVQIISITGFAILFYFKTIHPKSYNNNYTSYLLCSSILVALLFYGAHLGALLSGRI